MISTRPIWVSPVSSIFRNFPSPPRLFSVVKHRLPVIVVAGALIIILLAGFHVMIIPAVGGNGEFRVRDVLRKKHEHAKALDGRRKLID